jgi:ankyrin repeat protein
MPLTCRRFLLASLQCIHLSHLVRVSEVKQALKELPSGLESAYQGSLQRIGLESPERKSIAMTTLSWIYHSQRPLSIGELLHALAVDDTESLLNDEAVPPRNVIIGTCAGLVIFDAERDIVRFVHYSVHEYFKATYQRCFPNARVDITRTCFAYLRLENLAYDESASREAVDRLLSSYPFLKYAAQHWGSHAKDGFHRNMNGIALAFLENQSRVVLAAHLLDEDSMSANQTAPMFPSTNLPVQLSARFGALAIMHLLLERGHGLVGADTSGRTALHWAARGGFGDVVKAILRGGVDLGAKTRDGRTPLHWAAKHGHPHVVAELIRHGANPAEPTADGRTALHWAASRGHRSVVETLLSDARVHAACQSRNGWTALHWAACSGKRAVVTYGLDHLNLESPQTSCREHLSMSGGEPKGHEEVTMLLLKAEVSPHTRNKEGQTALHLAAASGNKKVAQRLLDYGADMGAQDTHGYTPWHFAVDNGVEDTIAAMFSTSTGSVVGSAATTCQS